MFASVMRIAPMQSVMTSALPAEPPMDPATLIPESATACPALRFRIRSVPFTITLDPPLTLMMVSDLPLMAVPT